MNILRLFTINILFFVFCFNGKATEIIGGSLRYEALGNQKYKIIGIVNRHCGGPSLAIPTFKIYSGNTSYTLTASRTSIKDITFVCSTATPPCNPANTSTSDGQEQHVFETTVDFSTAPYNGFYNSGQCEVIFSMESCCRSSNTMNITPNDFYLEAMLNLCKLGSTDFNSNNGMIPVTYADMYANLPNTYNLTFADKDSDSVYHTIEIPKKSKDSFERFIGQFSTKYPMSPFCPPYGTIDCQALPNAKPPRGFFFDNYSGEIILTPTVVNEKAIINIRTSEFRRINNIMTLIGYSTTELFFNVQASPDNNPPTIPTTNKWTVCEGAKLCFTIQSKDVKTVSQTAEDTTTLTWNFGIPAATFRIVDPTAREKSAEFCWQTKTGDARPNAYQFTVYAKDDNCPNPGITTKGFLINVKPKAGASRQYQQPVCGKLIFQAIPLDTIIFNGNYTYQWSIKDSSNSGAALYQSFKQQDSFTFTKKGIYIITHTINNLPLNCPAIYMDTVQIKCIGGGPTGIMKQIVSELTIYPNPTNGVISIGLNNNTRYTEMKLINAMGQIVYSGPASPTFDMSKFSKGIYTLEINSSEGNHITKVVKE